MMRGFLPLILLITGFAQSATVPSGTTIEVRLTNEVSSDLPLNRPADAVVITPVFVNGIQVIQAGAKLSGTTAEARAATPKTADGQEMPATLKLQFSKIEDGRQAKTFRAQVESVDNARETVKPDGLIVGIVESQTYAARIDQGLSKLATRYDALAQLLSGVRGALVGEVDPSIDYKTGVEMTLRLTESLEWEASNSSPKIAAITPANALAEMVTVQPFRTRAASPPSPSDITNLMFLGTREEITQTFQSAGWFAASQLSRSSRVETARAIIENRGYSEAPMSILNLEGRPPDLTFQKQNDTFEKRHHIRVWARPGRFNGKEIWVAAATHDISIMFSPESRSFTHGIDSNIDAERAKVVNDLLFTGLVNAIALVDRPAVPRDASNATGDRLITDGKMAVLEF